MDDSGVSDCDHHHHDDNDNGDCEGEGEGEGKEKSGGGKEIVDDDKRWPSFCLSQTASWGISNWFQDQ